MSEIFIFSVLQILIKFDNLILENGEYINIINVTILIFVLQAKILSLMCFSLICFLILNFNVFE